MKSMSLRSTRAPCPAAPATTQHIMRHFSPLKSTMRQTHIVRVGGFDEGAAQVRRLLDRDRKELDFDELESAFAEPPREGEAPVEASAAASAAAAAGRALNIEKTPANSGTRFSADKTPVSPFGPNSGSTASPFSSSSSIPSSPPMARKPFGEPAGLSPTMQPDAIDETPWWKNITATQIVITLSFTTIISLMIATFFFVVKVGAVRFNE